MAAQTQGRQQQFMNLAVLRGTVRADPLVVHLENGVVRLTFDVRCGSSGLDDTQSAERVSGEAVPVTWIGPANRVPTLATGGPVAVVGVVRRRFYRSGGALMSQTDVLAQRVVTSRSAQRKLLERATTAVLTTSSRADQ